MNMYMLEATGVCSGQTAPLWAELSWQTEACQLRRVYLVYAPAGNNLDDTAVADIMRALAANGEVQLTKLDLSGNNLLAQVRRECFPGLDLCVLVRN